MKTLTMSSVQPSHESFGDLDVLTRPFRATLQCRGLVMSVQDFEKGALGP